MSGIKVAFWNLQNLFDTQISPIAADLEFTTSNGWTEPVFRQKLENLAQVINLMHGGELPDLLGICEIENQALAEQLIGRLNRDDYELAHVESEDIRGIDTSLIYSREVFELAGEPTGHLIHMRYPTRDIFEVPLRVRQNGAEIHVMVNHWPSRSQGKYETEPFRISVAEHCGRLVDSILKYNRQDFLALPDTPASLQALNRRWDRNILLMGDFNDEPFDRSLLEFLQASNSEDHLEESIKKSGGSNLPNTKSYLGRQAYLFNCMWQLLAQPDQGTFYLSESTHPMNLLDQFIISRGLYYGLQGLKMDLDSVEIFKPLPMSVGVKKRPKKFEFTSNGIKTNGYSDHFPIQATLQVLEG